MYTLFPQIADIDTAYLLLCDYTRRHFPLVPYERLLTTANETDDVHGEILEVDKRWANSINLRAFAQPSVIIQPLTKFGLEDLRYVDLSVSVPDLVEAGLATQDPSTYEVTLVASIGDRFKFSGKKYSVVTFIPYARWANTDIILYYQLHSEIYRPSSERYHG